MRMKSISIYFFTIACAALWGSCKDETYPFVEQGSQQTISKELSHFERLTFKSSQDLLSAIQMGEKSTSEIGQTRSITFESLLSPCNKLTRA
ncbi:putative lipoprotein, partial [Bacteroides fragilis str. DS-71]